MDYTLNADEILAIEKYQNDKFKIMPSLLTESFESELRVSMATGKPFPFLTREEMEDALDSIKSLYSAIAKSFMRLKDKKTNKTLFKVIRQSSIKGMSNGVSSLFEATSNANKCARTAAAIKPTDRAIMLVDANVPWLNLESELTGEEDTTLFVPANVQITEAMLTSTKKFGREYIATLREIKIPEKTPKETNELREKILNATEKMSEYLKYILTVALSPNLQNNPRTISVMKEYGEWKKKIIEYSLEQYRLIKSKIIDAPPLVNVDRLNQENMEDREPDVLEDTVSLNGILSKLSPYELENLDLDTILNDESDVKRETENSQERERISQLI